MGFDLLLSRMPKSHQINAINAVAHSHRKLGIRKAHAQHYQGMFKSVFNVAQFWGKQKLYKRYGES